MKTVVYFKDNPDLGVEYPNMAPALEFEDEARFYFFDKDSVSYDIPDNRLSNVNSIVFFPEEK